MKEIQCLMPRYTVPAMISALLTVASLGCATAQAPQDKKAPEVAVKVDLGTAKAETSRWKIGTPIATYWGGPAITEATAKQMADGGFNLVWCETEAEMEIAKRHGLRFFLRNTNLLIPEALDYPDMQTELDALIERVKGNPAFYGYFLIDEPGASAFPEWAKLVAYLRAKDPKHLAYINLLPTYATNEGLGTEGDLVGRYNEYLRQYIEKVKPELLSYDHYYFSVGSDGVQYFLNLELMRQAALDAGIPFLNVVQASRWAEDIRVPNANEMRFLNYTSLGYGAQGLSYFLYYNEQLYQQFKPNAGQMMLPDGTPTPLYHAAKDLNPQFVAIASQLQPLRSLGAYHLGKVYDGVKPLPEKSPFTLDFAGKNKMPADGMLLGYFGKAGAPTHVVVVNLDHRNSVTTTVVGPKRLSVFGATARSWKNTPNSRVTLTLPPGGGKLVRIDE